MKRFGGRILASRVHGVCRLDGDCGDYLVCLDSLDCGGSSAVGLRRGSPARGAPVGQVAAASLREATAVYLANSDPRCMRCAQAGRVPPNLLSVARRLPIAPPVPRAPGRPAEARPNPSEQICRDTFGGEWIDLLRHVSTNWHDSGDLYVSSGPRGRKEHDFRLAHNLRKGRNGRNGRNKHTCRSTWTVDRTVSASLGFCSFARTGSHFIGVGAGWGAGLWVDGNRRAPGYRKQIRGYPSCLRAAHAERVRICEVDGGSLAKQGRSRLPAAHSPVPRPASTPPHTLDARIKNPETIERQIRHV